MQFPPVDDAAELVALGGLGLVGVDDGVLLQDAGAAGGLGAGVGLGLGRAPGAQVGGEGRHLATRWSRTKVSIVRGVGADSWEHFYLGFPELWVLYLSHTSCTAVNN